MSYKQKKSYYYCNFIDKCRQTTMYKLFYCNSERKIETIRKKGKNNNTLKK